MKFLSSKDPLCHHPCYCGKAVLFGTPLCHHPCYCGKAVLFGTPLCHHPCYCGKAVLFGTPLCHHRCYCGEAVLFGTPLCHEPCFECGLPTPLGTYVCVTCDTTVNSWTPYPTPVPTACAFGSNSTRQRRH